MKETQLKGEHKNHTRQIEIWYNLKDNNYIAYQYPKENISLYDYKQDLHMIFDGIYYERNNIWKLMLAGKISKYNDEIEIQKINVDDLGDEKYLLKIFSNKNLKRNYWEILFQLEKSEFPLVQVNFLDLSKNIHDKIYKELITNLPSEYYQIKNIEYGYKHGFIMNKDFSKCEKIDVNLQF